MTKQEFLDLVEGWSRAWDSLHAEGAEGFGDEETLEDWTGSIDAFHTLISVVDSPEVSA